MSWTIEFGRETPKDGRWSIMTVRPFGIRQVTRISQTTPLSSAAMFRFPHLGTPQSKIRVPHNESQMIHPTQQLSGSALAPYIMGLTTWH